MSPYRNATTPRQKLKITEKLLADHPLSAENVRNLVLNAWETVWNTRVGTGSFSFALLEVAPPAMVVGYLLEKVMAKMLATYFPDTWRGGVGSEKDLHYIPNDYFSIEVKTSGQLALEIFGNRSYSQELLNDSAGKKNKSGFYITVNFYNQSINLIRYGWIDSDDWQPQKTQTGQMSKLKDDVYNIKLLAIRGDYVLDGPLTLLPNVGEKRAAILNELGMKTIRDVLSFQQPGDHETVFQKALTAAKTYREQFA